MFPALLSTAEFVLTWLTHAAWQAGLLAAVVLALTWLLGSRLSPRWRFALWLVVFARLAVPVLPAAPWSVFRLVSVTGTSPTTSIADLSVAMPRPVVDEAINLQQDDAHDASFTPQTIPQSNDESAGAPANGKVAAVSPKVSTASLMQLAALIWLSGVVVLSLRLAANVLQLHRGQRQWQKIADPSALSVLRECSRELRLVQSVSLYATPEILGPATCGIIRPRIVLPQTLLDRLSPAELRLVLLHELVHVRRHDVLVDQLIGLITILHWFHPVAWVSRYFLRRERELACDAAVLDQAPNCEAADYGHVLLKTAEALTITAPLPGAVGMFSGGRFSLLERRVRLIAAHRRTTWMGLLFGGLLLVAVVLVGLTDAQSPAQSREPPQQTSPPKEKDKQPPPADATSAPATKDNESGQSQPAIASRPAGRTFPTTVFGRALDEQGRPVQGATIYLVLVNSSPNKLVAETMTDDSGRYEFRDAPLVSNGETGDFLDDVFFQVFGKAAGRAFAWRGVKDLHVDPRYASTPGYLPRDHQLRGFLLGEKIELDLTFPPARPITGRFVDDTGRPVADVSVSLDDCRYVNAANKYEDFELSGLKQAQQSMPGQLRATSDADGKFTLPHAPPNVVSRLGVSHPDHADISLRISTADLPPATYEDQPIVTLPLELTLHSVRTVPVVVKLADSDQPLAELGVSAYQAGRTGSSAFAKSDQEGKLTLKLPPGKYRLGANPPPTIDYVPAREDIEVSLTPDQQPVVLRIQPGCILILRATDADSGAPIPGVTFWQQELTFEAGMLPGKRNVPLHPSRTSYPKTEERGNVRTVAVPGARRYGVGRDGVTLPEGYEAADEADHRLGRELILIGGQTLGVEFKLQKKNATGALKSKAEPAKAVKEKSENTEPKPAKANGGDKNKPVVAPAEKAAQPQIRNHPLSVSGKAIDQNGKPIAGATIFLVATNNSPDKLIGQTATGDDGRYEFRNAQLPYYTAEKKDDYEDGTFQVFGKAPGVGFAWHGMRFLHIDPRHRDENGKSLLISPSYGFFPAEAIDLDLIFQPAKPVRGRFVDDQGQPIQGVKVSLTNCDFLDTNGREDNLAFREFRSAVRQAQQAMPDQLQCTSDANGRFEFKSVPQGIGCRLAMRHPEYGVWALYTATADSPPQKFAGADVASLPIEMVRQKTRTISLLVRYADTREPAVGAHVGAYLQLGTNNDWGECDKQGKVTFKLPPDEYTAWAHPPKGADYLSVHAPIVVKPTEQEQSAELVLDRACVLLLKASDEATGAGVEKVNFWYEDESQPGKKWFVQSNDTTNDFPVTNAQGELRALVRPGTRRYGIGLNPLPDNYRADNDDKTSGRVLTLPAGQTVTAEFLLQK